MSTFINNKDEIIMSLVHYFVTEENYTPINVQGAKNEIWLENLEGPYKIIRINSKYIHNDEQYKLDLLKMDYVIKQIKKKTLSLKMNALNICLDVGYVNNLSDKGNYNIDTLNITNLKDIRNDDKLGSLYPKIKTERLKKADNLDDIIHVTDDINKKTERENTKYENVFKPKKIVVTNVLVTLCIVIYIVSLFTNITEFGANHRGLVLNGDIYRLLLAPFLHGSSIHLLVNMYSLWIIGSQVETYMGKWRVLVIYLLSALMGSVFSIVFLENSYSVGASGAIFGLMGALLYFGYHYRLYLSGVLTNQIVPIIIANLAIGFMVPWIDNFAHIGGLIGGYLASMIVGVKYKSSKNERINGIIVYILLLGFLNYTLLYLI